MRIIVATYWGRSVSKAKDDANREFTSVSERTSRSGGAIGHVDLTHSACPIPVEPDMGLPFAPQLAQEGS